MSCSLDGRCCRVTCRHGRPDPDRSRSAGSRRPRAAGASSSVAGWTVGTSPAGMSRPAKSIPHEALIRECFEELGVHVTDPLPIPMASDDPDIEVHAFLVTRWHGEPVNAAPDEHDDLRWFGPTELAGLTLADPAGLPSCTVAARVPCRHGRPDPDRRRSAGPRRSRAAGASSSVARVVPGLLGPRRRARRDRRVAARGGRPGVPRGARRPRARPPADPDDVQRPHPRGARVPRDALGRGAGQLRTRGARRPALVRARRARRPDAGRPGRAAEPPGAAEPALGAPGHDAGKLRPPPPERLLRNARRSQSVPGSAGRDRGHARSGTGRQVRP